MRLFVFLFVVCFSPLVKALEAPPSLRFDVVRYELSGENPLPAETVTKVLKPFLGRHFGLDGLSAAVAEMERKLKELGYSFHRVVLEPQSLRDGVVKLRVYEFKLGTLTVSGQKHFSEQNIKNSLPSLIEGKAPNTRLLSQSLSIANDHPDKSLQMLFKEGKKLNTVDVELKVADKSPTTAYAKLSNTGSEETGELRLGLGYQYSNLLDKDHKANINFSTSVEHPDKVAQWVLSYTLPFYERGDLMTLYFSDSEIDTTSTLEGLNGLFNIKGTGQVFGVRYMQGFKKTKGYKHKLYYGFDRKVFNNQILFNNTPTAGTNEIISAPLSVEYEFSRPRGRSPFRLAISYFQNLVDDQAAYDFETRQPGTNWDLIRLRAKYDWPVADSLVRIRLEAQHTGQTLIAGEQFGVGGAESTRGYQERAILGDRGYGINLEYWNTPAKKKLRWLIFYDYAATKFLEDLGTGVLEEKPSSVGAGIRWRWKRNINIPADLAVAQSDAGETESGDSTLHFNMIYQY